ncbi:unnamed protein product [Clavelina lepadiformis]|uniref:MARVEL domain-containing protein n=1 Tax=Clavelina lepadiformis TaxID=159417 RepID=A0ABP0FEM0_CLALP
MESGPKYAISKEGLLKLIVLVFGCTTFALFADSGAYGSPPAKTWAFAAYIISWSISLLFYFFHVTGLARGMNCSVNFTYIGFDFIWAWLSTFHVFAASITFAININCNVSNNTKYCSEQAGSIALGFATFILYAVEAFFLKGYAPANTGYIATLRGWFKTAVLVGGAASFSLLVDSGYKWCGGGCGVGVTYALSAYCIGWTVTLLIFVAKLFMPEDKAQSKFFIMFHFGWSIISALLFITASSCFAAFMRCHDFDQEPCKKRLGGIIFGFITAILYVIDALLNRPSK